MTAAKHVAIIMDGNGRWAEARGLPRVEGHRRGVASVRAACELAAERKIEALTLYCLSSENWKRPQTELDFLMQLLHQYVIEERELIMDQNMRLMTIGRRDRLPSEVNDEIDETIRLSATNTGTRLVLAIDYGGRDEIVRAAAALVAQVQSGELLPSEINESTLEVELDTAGLPEVDLVIRTGGDYRISNFLLWQISYAELWVTATPWPDFDKECFATALDDFARRQRRFGGLDSDA